MMMKRFDDLTAEDEKDPEYRKMRDAAYQQAVREQIAYGLAELRRTQEFTQSQLARSLGVSQGSISRLEHQEDLKLSTLAAYIEALGGRLTISADFDGQRIELAGPRTRTTV